MNKINIRCAKNCEKRNLISLMKDIINKKRIIHPSMRNNKIKPTGLQ